MRIKEIASVGLIAACLALPGGGALAQTIEIGPGGITVGPSYEPEERRPPPRYDGISERQAVRIARREGVEEVVRVRPTPRGWVVRGSDRNGDEIRVVISQDGDVIDVR